MGGLLFALAAHGTTGVDKCRRMKELAPEVLGGIRAEFLAQHNGRYTIEVEPPAVRNQCQFGGCWAYSTLAEIETEIHTRTGKRIDLSEQYLIARNLMEKIDRALDAPKGKVTEGNHFTAAEWLIRRYGMIPAGAWEPRVPFESSPHSKRMLLFMNHRLAEYHLAVAGLAPGAPKRAELLAAAKTDLQNIFDTYLGPLPKTVDFEGKQYTPEEFAKAFISPGHDPVLWVAPKRQPLPAALLPKLGPKPATTATTKPAADLTPKYLYEDWPAIEQRIVESLRAGRAVPISIEMAHEFLDSKTGILSLSAFHTPEGFQPVDEAARRHFDIEQGTHAVDIIGVDLDPAGRVIKFKVRNSWGERHGDKGVDHMYPDYFRAYTNHLFFR